MVGVDGSGETEGGSLFSWLKRRINTTALLRRVSGSAAWENSIIIYEANSLSLFLSLSLLIITFLSPLSLSHHHQSPSHSLTSLKITHFQNFKRSSSFASIPKSTTSARRMQFARTTLISPNPTTRLLSLPLSHPILPSRTYISMYWRIGPSLIRIWWPQQQQKMTKSGTFPTLITPVVVP